MTSTDTSGACCLGEQEDHGVLGCAMTKHLLRESRKDVVEHTAASRLLAQDGALADWVGVNLGETWLAAARVYTAVSCKGGFPANERVNAMRKWPGSQRAAQSVFALDEIVERRTE